MATPTDFSAAEELELQEIDSLPIQGDLPLQINFFNSKIDVISKYMSPDVAKKVFGDAMNEITKGMPLILENLSKGTKVAVIIPTMTSLLLIRKFFNELTLLCSNQLLNKISNKKYAYLAIAPVISKLYDESQKLFKNNSDVLSMEVYVKNFKTPAERDAALVTYRQEFTELLGKIANFSSLAMEALTSQEIIFKKLKSWRSSPSYKSRRQQLAGAQQRPALVAKAPWKCNLCNDPKCKHCLHCQFGNCDKRENGFTHSE